MKQPDKIGYWWVMFRDTLTIAYTETIDPIAFLPVEIMSSDSCFSLIGEFSWVEWIKPPVQ